MNLDRSLFLHQFDENARNMDYFFNKILSEFALYNSNLRHKYTLKIFSHEEDDNSSFMKLKNSDLKHKLDLNP